MRVSVLLASVAIAAAVPASAATVLFSQNFDGLPQGIPAGSVPGFAISGTVDVVTSGNFSIDCVGNTGACLDIDGTPGPGALTSNISAFAAGRRLTVSFDLSGNQRGQLTDEFSFEILFGTPTGMLDVQCPSGFLLTCNGDLPSTTTSISYIEFIPGIKAWTSYNVSFTPDYAGSLQLRIASTSADNIGPILDNVLITQAAVPEPASWAMLIAGFGLVGAVCRRQRFVVA